VSERYTVRASRRELRIKAFYTLGELASAAFIDPRTLRSALVQCGVQLVRAGRMWLVPLAELEGKARLLWEGIRSASGYRHGGEDER
jgi:hypothetical protein